MTKDDFPLRRAAPAPRRRMRSAVVVALALVMVAAFASTAGAAGVTTPKICGTFSGPHWSYKGRSGTSYIAYTLNGGSCAFGLSWAPRLFTKHPHGPTYAISGGPSGWACSNSALRFGLCSQTVDGHAVKGGKAFAWGPKTG